jgi:DNA-binding CsgD family transcriptional regulator
VARLARAAGATELASRAATAAGTFARLNPGVRLFAGVAAHSGGVAFADSARLVEAVSLLEGTQRPLLLAAAAEDAGRALVDHGDAGAAVEYLDRAFHGFAVHGATADARRVGRLLRAQGRCRRLPGRDRPDRGWASLTASEMTVVRLVATGATNRTAAEQLFLSPHTVSSHLRSAFTKLGIHSRVQLAGVVRDADG